MKLHGVAPAQTASHGAPDDLTPPGPSNNPNDALLASLGCLAEERALILGPDIEIMCALIRGGCREVTEIEQGVCPDARGVDLVIVPTVRTVDAALRAISQARRALTPSGRIVVRTAAYPAERLSRAVGGILRLHGFAVLAVAAIAGRTVFSAEVDPLGPLAAALGELEQ